MFLNDEATNDRLAALQNRFPPNLNSEARAAYLFAYDLILGSTWHWLQFHFSLVPAHPIAVEIAQLCAKIEGRIPEAGKQLINSIAGRGNRERNERDYQGILQDFAEILVISRLLDMSWPANTAFFYEPEGRSGKRPELLVSTAGKSYLFEVKAPSLLEHQRQRAKREVQLPTRGVFPLEHIDSLVNRREATLPRDNPIKDFLISGEEKFAGFELGDGANILIIVWDDFIYEPISSLANKMSGLITEQSYFKDRDGMAVTFPHVDAVIVVRHLNYFVDALANRPLPDRLSAFDFGGDRALPNVCFPTRWGRRVPSCVSEALRAVDYQHPSLQKMAEYREQDIVFWMK